MALPTSGPLSFSMIAEQLQLSSPYSLRNMADIAGFSTPNTVSEFYGYDPGSDPILFFISSPVNDPAKICIEKTNCCTSVWHNGTNLFPEVGNIVYEDASGTIPLSPFEDNIFFGMNEFECGVALSWFKLSSEGDGLVIDVGSCKK